MDRQNFIYVSDFDIYKKLKQEGFNEISEGECGFYIFLNDRNIDFLKDTEKSKIKYSNTLNI